MISKINLTKLKMILFSLNSLLFIILYKISEIYASNLDNVTSIFMNWEKNIPFLPIFIIPYMTSGLLFSISFFLFKDKKSLIIYSKRTAFLTMTSVGIFFIYPLSFNFIKPNVDNIIYKFLFTSLDMFDSSFNQCPSLHVSYSYMYIHTFYKEMKSKFKYLICLWSFLISISVLFVYQHHFIDYIGGLVIFILTINLISNKK